jgi:hypothetical protein
LKGLLNSQITDTETKKYDIFIQKAVASFCCQYNLECNTEPMSFRIFGNFLP